MTRTPNSPVLQQSEVPSEPARLAAEAVMSTTFPNVGRDESGLGSFDCTGPSR